MATFDGPEPSDMDRALLRLITEALDGLPPDSATLSHAWSEGGSMWVVEVRPRAEGAAALDIAFDGGDLLNFTVGNIWFEVFPVESVEDLDYARDIALAVFQGDVEESTYKNKAWGRIHLDDRQVGVGSVHIPWPGRTRSHQRRYKPYA